jgi:hypothetical protein
VRRSIACALALAPLVGACYRHEYAVSGTVPRNTPTYSEWQHHFLSGLVDLSPEIELRDTCPEGVSRIIDSIEPLNVLVYVLTATIYSPSTVEIYCRDLDEVPERVEPPRPRRRARRQAVPRDAAVRDASVGEDRLDAGT